MEQEGQKNIVVHEMCYVQIYRSVWLGPTMTQVSSKLDAEPHYRKHSQPQGLLKHLEVGSAILQLWYFVVLQAVLG